jgi:hypothetical protein
MRWKTERGKRGGYTGCLAGSGGGRRRPNSVETGSGGRLGLAALRGSSAPNRWSSGEIETRMRHVQKRFEDEGIMWVF